MTVTLPRPSDIDASKHMYSSFGQSESEVSAGYIVRFMQERQKQGRKDWESFTYADIDDFYTRKGAGNGYTFNRLIGHGNCHASEGYNQTHSSNFLAIDEQGNMKVTLEFISRCFKSSPAG